MKAAWVALVLFQLALYAVIVYVAVHFITKVW